MNDFDTYNPAQLQQLADMFPDKVRIDGAGAIFPLITREEVRALAQRYPSNFKTPPAVPEGQDPRNPSNFPVLPAPEGQGVLATRYPSMFK